MTQGVIKDKRRKDGRRQNRGRTAEERKTIAKMREEEERILQRQIDETKRVRKYKNSQYASKGDEEAMFEMARDMIAKLRRDAAQFNALLNQDLDTNSIAYQKSLINLLKDETQTIKALWNLAEIIQDREDSSADAPDIGNMKEFKDAMAMVSQAKKAAAAHANGQSLKKVANGSQT